MEQRDLEYFAVIAEHGNLHRAAEALDISQPALSKSLRRLETWAQTKLVKRTPKGVELTPVGTVLFAHAKRLHLSLDDIEREVAELRSGRAGSLHAGVEVFHSDHLMPQVCATFLRDAPMVSLKVTIGAADILYPALRRGDLDILVTFLPAVSGEIAVQELFQLEFVVFASANHLLAKSRKVTIADLVHERWAAVAEHTPPWQRLMRVFADQGLPPPRIGLETSSISIRLWAVASSSLLGFTARRVLQEAPSQFRLVELPVRELAWSRRFGICYRKDAYLSPAARRFIEILKSTAGKTDGA
jgi:DNA-binding transcriptional LysR family regulator